MLAALPDAEVAAIIDRIEGVVAAQYPGYSPEIIGRDVARTREQGYALNPGRVIANSWGIGMAILLPDGRLAGALSIAAIDSRMNEMRQKELMALLRQEVERVQGKLKALFGGEKAPIPKPQLAARTRAPERV